ARSSCPATSSPNWEWAAIGSRPKSCPSTSGRSTGGGTTGAGGGFARATACSGSISSSFFTGAAGVALRRGRREEGGAPRRAGGGGRLDPLGTGGAGAGGRAGRGGRGWRRGARDLVGRLLLVLGAAVVDVDRGDDLAVARQQRLDALAGVEGELI